MDKPSCSVVLTTISDGALLDEYFENFKKFNRLEKTKLFVIPDKKTPAGLFERCASLGKKGLDIVCPTIAQQEEYLKKLGPFSKLVPYNSDNRRNIGYLMAYESGSEFVISIDDDNFCQPDVDFFAEHSVVCRGPQKSDLVSASGGWFNICDMILFEPAYRVYPRGFPYNQRHKAVDCRCAVKTVDVHLNGGLWLLDPDVDGITWLAAPVSGRSVKSKSLAMEKDTWTPINTQNTSLHRDVIPSYYFIRMGYPFGTLSIDRYGDIFSGYFAQACVKHLGYYVRVGTPVCEHRRNSHNYLRDATNELMCIWVLEDLTAWLKELKLQGGTYFEAYEALSYAIEDAVEYFNGFIWTDSVRGYFHQMAYCMRQWIGACKLLTA